MWVTCDVVPGPSTYKSGPEWGHQVTLRPPVCLYGLRRKLFVFSYSGGFRTYEVQVREPLPPPFHGGSSVRPVPKGPPYGPSPRSTSLGVARVTMIQSGPKVEVSGILDQVLTPYLLGMEAG